MVVSKDHLNRLIERLTEDDLPIAADFLEKLISKSNDGPIPWDDEPTTQDDIEDIKKAKEAYSHGDTIKFKEVMDDLLN